MMPTFASPLFLWGSASLAGLALIYMLRMRSRRKVVSSLLLWVDRRTADTGGRIWQKMRTPLLFFVELLALALLVLAAADPLWPRAGRLPVVVVLDNSFSMRASLDDAEGNAGGRTVKDAAAERLAEILDKESIRARVVLAGIEPTLLRDPLESSAALSRLDAQWTCWAPTADLAAALTLARQVGGPDARLLVLTDHPASKAADEKTPDSDSEEASDKENQPIDPGKQVRWLAFGRPIPNLALVGAVRRDADDEGLAVVEVANLSDSRRTGELSVQLGPRHSVKAFNIPPGDVSRFTIPLDDTSAPLKVALPPDALEVDNQLTLLPEHPPKLRVSVGIGGAKLKAAVERVLKAAGSVEVTDVAPQLRFSDAAEKPRDDCWDVLFAKGADPKPVMGPFVLDRTNPLLEGISLQNVVLVESKDLNLTGNPLVMSDTGVLVSADRTGGRRRRLTIQFDVEKTTLLDSIDFPAFIWNILQWRQGELPEHCRPNVALGTTNRLRLTPDRTQTILERPDGSKTELKPRDGAVVFATDLPGAYSIVLDGERRLPLSAHATFRDESDLRNGTTGKWGKWVVTQEARLDFRSLAAALLFVALATWLVHGWLLRREVPSE